MSDPRDLGGEWEGEFRYPGLLPPVAFRAALAETAGWIAGTIEEESAAGIGPKRRLGASVQGRRAGGEVTWLKLYDECSEAYDAVSYQGEVSADGERIQGRWSIAENWSGGFEMTRRSRKAAAQERRAATEAER